MFVERLLAAAHKRLITISADASFLEAARFLGSGTDLVVVCSSDDTIVGVITKTDVVRQIGAGQRVSFGTPASAVMTSRVILCQPGDWLNDVWIRMREGALENVPIIDESGRPLGLLNARDALQILLEEAEDEEALLLNYVMGVGYQ
jgi:CBS domain-containing protein